MHVLVLYFFEQLNCNNWETETEKFRSLAFYLAYRRADVGNATFLSTLFPLSPLSKTFHFPRNFFGKWKVFGKFLESFGKSVKNALFYSKKEFSHSGLAKNFPKKQKLSKNFPNFPKLSIFCRFFGLESDFPLVPFRVRQNFPLGFWKWKWNGKESCLANIGTSVSISPRENTEKEKYF